MLVANQGVDRMRKTVQDEAGDHVGTLALLIDGDNATPKIVTGLLAESANYGTASVKRVYGDWTKPSLNGWKECLLEHSIQPVQQFAYTVGKNATDGAMIFDAMDLLYTGRFDGLCIVSSDSDFARLAARIREQGVTVDGFGERKTPRPFITACDKFVHFDVLKAPGEEAAVTPAAQEEAKATAKKNATDKVLLALLRTAVLAVSDETGWANRGAVGSHVAKQSPEFDSRNFGFARLSELVEATGKFEIDRDGKMQKGVRIRLKPAPPRSRTERKFSMARKSIEERLAQIEAQRKTLKARLGKQERAEDTRRKVLLGALVLHRLEHGKDHVSRSLPAWLAQELPDFLTRDIDKALFADLLNQETSSSNGGNGADTSA